MGEGGGVGTPSGGDPRDGRFVDADLRGARLVRTDLRGAVLRGVDVDGMDIDSPWLLDEAGSLLVSGVDVVPFVDAELDRRFPGRALRRATDPEGLRAAFAAVAATWDATVARASALPAAALDARVDGEWSFAETLRHLVMATDVWFRGAILRIPRPFHPLGMPNAEFATDGYDTSVFTPGTPAFADVLAARADRTAAVRAHVDGVTAAQLAEPRRDPWSPDHEVTVGSCLRVILGEEWEHHRYAVRDLASAARAAGAAAG